MNPLLNLNKAPVAVLDACVIYPNPLRDFLLQLSQTGIYRPRWTETIRDEWMRNLLNKRPHLDPAKLQRVWDLMNTAVPDSLIEDYEPLIPDLALPDDDDRHVLAAAIKAGAQKVVTFNLRDFPVSALAEHGISAQHPDEFISGLVQRCPEDVVASARTCRRRLMKPPLTVDEYLERLERQQLTRTTAFLRQHAGAI